MRILIIGSGSEVFAAGIYATNHGADVVIIEAGTLEGTCVNVGCVPFKIFIRAAQLAHDQQHHSFNGLGKSIPSVKRSDLVRQQEVRVAVAVGTRATTNDVYQNDVYQSISSIFIGGNVAQQHEEF